MAMMPRFELRQGQTQSLVMTPQLQQAIKLLQMSNMELTEYVDAELERNPLLERDERSDEPETASLNEDSDNRKELELDGSSTAEASRRLHCQATTGASTKS